MTNFEYRTNGGQAGGQEQYKKQKNNDFIQCEEGPGVVAYLLTLGGFQTLSLVTGHTSHYVGGSGEMYSLLKPAPNITLTCPTPFIN